MNRKAFIASVSEDLARHGVHLQMVDASSVHKKYAGWFDASNRKLVIARRHKDFLGVLLHEYCHFRQWRENRQRWNKLARQGDIFFKWLYTRPSLALPPQAAKVQKARKAAQQLEYDCERRAIAMIKKLKLPIDVRAYSRRANAYLISYHLMVRYHSWPGKRSVYSPSICKLMPSTLLSFSQISREATVTETMVKKMHRCF